LGQEQEANTRPTQPNKEALEEVREAKDPLRDAFASYSAT